MVYVVYFFFIVGIGMLVYLHVKACAACDKGFVSTEVVDISLEDIRPNFTAMPCSCGYYKEYQHTPMSFSKWKAATRMANSYITEYQKDLEIEDQMEKDMGRITERMVVRRAYLKEQIEAKKALLSSLGKNPVPDHLF